MTVVLTLLQNVVYLLSPLFGASLADVYAESGWSTLINIGISYGMTALTGVLLYIIERKRIPHVKLHTKIFSVLLWPIFIFLSVPMEIVALFAKNLGWKPIPHNDTTDFDKLNKTPCFEEKAPEPAVAISNSDKIA